MGKSNNRSWKTLDQFNKDYTKQLPASTKFNNVPKKDDVVKDIKYSSVANLTGGKVILTKVAQKIINYLLDKFPHTEWSGILVWDIVSGSLADIKNLVIKVNYVFAMDIGSSGYTEYDNNAELTLDLYDEFPSAINMRLGHAHSHHSMDTFFSSTDMDELHNNADKYVAYLSIIVNNKGSVAPRIAIVVDEISTTKFKDFDDTIAEVSTTNKKLIIYTPTIGYEEEANSFSEIIDKRLAKIRSYVKPKPVYQSSYNPPSHSTYEAYVKDPHEVGTYIYLPSELTDRVLAEILEMPVYTVMGISEVDKREQNPLAFSNIDTIIYDCIDAEAQELFVKDDLLFTNYMYPDIFVVAILRALQKSANFFPEGQTKELLTDSLARLLGQFMIAVSELEADVFNRKLAEAEDIID